MSTVRTAPGRVAAVLLGALVVLSFSAPEALGARTVVIRGRGWGHGIGMSQYGALGRARNGRSAREILTHYYSGVRVRRARLPERVRVGLLASRGKVRVTSLRRPGRTGGGKLAFRLQGARRLLAEGGPGVSWRIEPTRSGKMRLFRNGERVRKRGRSAFGSPSRPLLILYSGSGTLVRMVQKRLNYAYGRISVAPHASACRDPYCLRAVLSLTAQKYLLGLHEVPASWPSAALRAQTIAGRTYALEKIRRLGQHRPVCDCALYDSTIDQVYNGDLRRTEAGSYWPRWRRAVRATKGEVVLYRGRPIQAYYSSSSGGHTENVENVWGGERIPYLRGVTDRADAVADNPNHRWRVEMPWRTFARRLEATFGVGRLRRVRLVRPFGVSGRVTVAKPGGRGGVRLVGSRATRRVDGWDVRSALGLRDTWFRIRVVRSERAGRQHCERAAWRAAGSSGSGTATARPGGCGRLSPDSETPQPRPDGPSGERDAPPAKGGGPPDEADPSPDEPDGSEEGRDGA